MEDGAGTHHGADLDKIVFADIASAVQAIKEGKMVVVMDDEDRENEGDIIMAAECVSAAQCALTIRHSTGILCAPMTPERASELALPRMVARNQVCLCIDLQSYIDLSFFSRM
jgi:3,4-dihydroxy-2-butanone 4-phosphate synthase